MSSEDTVSAFDKSSLRSAWKHTKTPISIKIEFPINLVTKSEKIFFITSPHQTDIIEMKKEIINKIGRASCRERV